MKARRSKSVDPAYFKSKNIKIMLMLFVKKMGWSKHIKWDGLKILVCLKKEDKTYIGGNQRTKLILSPLPLRKDTKKFDIMMKDIINFLFFLNLYCKNKITVHF